MDTGQLVFRGMYKAVAFLGGMAARKAGDVPGLLSIITEATPLEALPAQGVMVAFSMPSLALNFHSMHALVLFNALRAESKYGDMRDQLRTIQEAMDAFIKSMNSAIDASSPVPDSLPSTDARALFFDAQRNAAYKAELDAAIGTVRSFVGVLDLVLDDVTRCLREWNAFLGTLQRFLKEDKPRNIFETLGKASVHNERDWAWYQDETGFSSTCNLFVGHRNHWAKLLDLRQHLPLPRLNFDTAAR